MLIVYTSNKNAPFKQQTSFLEADTFDSCELMTAFSAAQMYGTGYAEHNAKKLRTNHCNPGKL